MGRSEDANRYEEALSRASKAVDRALDLATGLGRYHDADALWGCRTSLGFLVVQSGTGRKSRPIPGQLSMSSELD